MRFHPDNASFDLAIDHSWNTTWHSAIGETMKPSRNVVGLFPDSFFASNLE